ncbi:hypothetical protein CMK11_20315 [Candidatus Poribacteria bacterium]|nr:hypothetical protein [Candidatus Poribacteria bacterium]
MCGERAMSTRRDLRRQVALWVFATLALARAIPSAVAVDLTELDRTNLRFAWQPEGRAHPLGYTPHQCREIYAMDADGSNITRLTHNDATDTTPTWLPDGRIAFQRHSGPSRASGKAAIYSVDADGSDERWLMSMDEWQTPSWSPDGQHIVFASGSAGRNPLYIADADGGSVERVTDGVSNYRHAVWMPDGARIAYYSDHGPGYGLYTMDPDGSDVRRLSDHAVGDAAVAWSPDGREVAIASTLEGARALYVVDPYSGSFRRLTYNDVSDPYPAWSPSGDRIAYADSPGQGMDIYVIRRDGSAQTRLTYDDADDERPAWSPDGSRIAFDSNRDGDGTFEVGSVRLSGISSRVPVSSPVDPAAPRPTLRVLAVGVSRADGNIWDRRYGADDARDFAAACRGQAGELYGDVQTRALVDAAADGGAIREGLAWLRDTSEPGDVAFVFLSLHQVEDEVGDGYLCTYDADPASPIDGVPRTDVTRILGLVTSRLVVFADMQASAAWRGGAMKQGAAAYSAYYELPGLATAKAAIRARDVGRLPSAHAWPDSRARCVWPATIGRGPTVESEAWRNGAFTEALLASMSDPATDVDGDGILTELELAVFVSHRVTELTAGAQRFCPSRRGARDLPLFAAADDGR